MQADEMADTQTIELSQDQMMNAIIDLLGNDVAHKMDREAFNTLASRMQDVCVIALVASGYKLMHTYMHEAVGKIVVLKKDG